MSTIAIVAIVIAAVCGLLIVVGAVASVVSPDKTSRTGGEQPAATATAPPANTAPTTAAPPTTTTPAQTTTTAPTTPQEFTMPNLVGAVLQTAQDKMQEVVGNPAFFTYSKDLRGTRLQVNDRNWKVCTQNVQAGAKVTIDTRIEFGVVKLEESCP